MLEFRNKQGTCFRQTTNSAIGDGAFAACLWALDHEL